MERFEQLYDYESLSQRWNEIKSKRMSKAMS